MPCEYKLFAWKFLFPKVPRCFTGFMMPLYHGEDFQQRKTKGISETRGSRSRSVYNVQLASTYPNASENIKLYLG